MDFLKKNYEKLILGVVLLGLAVAVAYLPIKSNKEKEDVANIAQGLTTKPVKPLTNIDMTLPDAALKLMGTPELINFSEPHKLFNPMPWQRTVDGRLIRADKVGPSALTVTNIVPLYLKLTLDSITVLDTGTKYVIGVERQAAPRAADRVKKESYCTLNVKNEKENFTLIGVKGKPDDPTELTVLLNDTGDQGVIGKDKDHPFKRVDGYMADLAYPIERKTWTARRVGSTLPFNGEEYNIVAINQNEVVLSASRNQKKWTIKYNPGP
jgi:hypothetical protein